MADWYCSLHNTLTDETDVDTMYLEFDGIQEAHVCEECKDWWFDRKVVAIINKGEADCEAKMA